MNPIEFRLNQEAVRPLLLHIRPILERLHSELAADNEPPAEDEALEAFWTTDLLNSQRKDIAAIAGIFDDEFMETGRAILDMEDVDLFVRGCAAVRLKIREESLGEFDDEALEQGELDFDSMTDDERIGYGAYALFASLQEMLIAQLSHEEDEDDLGDEDEFHL